MTVVPDPPEPTQSFAMPSRRAIATGTLAGAVAVVAIVVAATFALDVVSLKTVGLNYEWLRTHIDANVPLAAALYVGAYTLLGALALPGSALFVIASGLFFGAGLGIALAMAGSLLAATAAYFVARTALGRHIARISHLGFVRFKAGFARHALSYMLFLRLSPGLPFALLNIVPSLLGVRFSTYFVGTLAGMLPSRIALSTAGAGLGHAIGTENAKYFQCMASPPPDGGACGYDIGIASLLTAETVAAFVALAFLALLPAIYDAVVSGCRSNSIRR